MVGAGIVQARRLKVPAAGPQVLLFARSGFSPALRQAAASDAQVTLVDVQELVSTLDAEAHDA